MKENDVAQISEQFGIEKSIVEASINDGTLGQRIKDSLSTKVIYDKPEFEAFKKNYAAEVTNNYYSELVEQTKKGEAPQELYKNIKGSAYQQLEREFAQEHDIKEEYKGIKDLIGKVIAKSSATGKLKPEIEKEINDLKEANVRLLKEKEDAVLTVRNEYKGIALNSEMSQVLSQIPFDFSDVKAEELESKKQKAQTLLRSVFNQEYKLDADSQNRTVVLKGTDILKNQATLEPRPLKDVLIDLAKEYNLKLTSPDNGGQGGSSSNRSAGVLFKNVDEFHSYCESNNLHPHSAEALKLWKDSGIK